MMPGIQHVDNEAALIKLSEEMATAAGSAQPKKLSAKSGAEDGWASRLKTAAQNPAVKVSVAGGVLLLTIIKIFLGRRSEGAPLGRAANGSAKGKQLERFLLAASHTLWLASMKRKYALEDVGKSLRVVICYAQEKERLAAAAPRASPSQRPWTAASLQTPDSAAANVGAAGAAGRGREVLEVPLRAGQVAWLRGATPKGGDLSATVRVLLDWAMGEPEGPLFTIKRGDGTEGARCNQ